MIEIANPTPYLPSALRAAVLDWAGTTIDFGSRAPIAAILTAFEQAGVKVSDDEARRPMGRAKLDHLRELLSQPQVALRWQAANGSPPDDAAVEGLYRSFLAIQAECIASHSQMIDGACESVSACRALGLAIGSTTGYTRELLDPIAATARVQGYAPDVSLCADDVSPGRPAPWLCVETAKRLGVYPMAAVVKVDDTVAGVAAGRNAGAWSVGVVVSGNEVGLSREAFDRLDAADRETRYEVAVQRLSAAGAHFLIETIVELPMVVERINERLAAGVGP